MYSDAEVLRIIGRSWSPFFRVLEIPTGNSKTAWSQGRQSNVPRLKRADRHRGGDCLTPTSVGPIEWGSVVVPRQTSAGAGPDRDPVQARSVTNVTKDPDPQRTTMKQGGEKPSDDG